MPGVRELFFATIIAFLFGVYLNQKVSEWLHWSGPLGEVVAASLHQGTCPATTRDTCAATAYYNRIESSPAIILPPDYYDTYLTGGRRRSRQPGSPDENGSEAGCYGPSP